MSTKIAALFVFIISLAMPSFAKQPKDPLYRSLTEKELATLIQRTPISSVKHRTLPISALQLKKVAVREYALIWKRNTRNPWATLRYGRNLQSYVSLASYYPKEKLPMGSAEANKLMAQVGILLEDAVRAMPNVAEANTAYGWFLIDHKHTLRQGLAYLEKGVELDSRDSGARALLAEALMNPSNPLYNPKRAEREILQSIAINRVSSYPRYLLLRLYIGEKQYQKARKALDDYCNLVTPEMAKGSRGPWQKIIDQGLATSKANR